MIVGRYHAATVCNEILIDTVIGLLRKGRTRDAVFEAVYRQADRQMQDLPEEDIYNHITSEEVLAMLAAALIELSEYRMKMVE